MAIPEFLHQLASRADVTWSIATFGAIAEFSYTDQEKTDTHVGESTIKIASPRGALRFHIPSAAHIVAYEGLSKHPDLWSQGISVCLPETNALLASTATLKEVGPDGDAIHEQDREGVLFDIGLGAPHVQACIRTPDADLIAVLREHANFPLFGENATALHEILHRSPDRVFLSQLGRIEVATPITHEDDETALGPHTHVLPELLAHDRTHAANLPVPSGYLPCLNVFPPNPARDERGDARSFDPEDHTRFQGILRDHGDPAANRTKRLVTEHLSAGHDPTVMNPNLNRIERTALRVTLRQYFHTHGDSDLLESWRIAFEPNDGEQGQSG